MTMSVDEGGWSGDIDVTVGLLPAKYIRGNNVGHDSLAEKDHPLSLVVFDLLPVRSTVEYLAWKASGIPVKFISIGLAARG